jgi:hypothetical protein
MKIFVMCGGKGVRSGRILAHQLKARLKGRVTVECGTAEQLEAKKDAGQGWLYVLNMGETKRVYAGCRVLNEIQMVKTLANRRTARMKFKLRHLPHPALTLKPSGVTMADLPVVGRPSNSDKGEKNMWLCFTMESVARAAAEGATHFVDYVMDSREFRVHVVAPHPDIFTAMPADYQVIKISERVTYNKGDEEVNPANKASWSSFHFGALKNPEDPLIPALRIAARNVLSDLRLHWGAITFLAGEDGLLKVSKVDTHIDLHEDQSNSMVRYSNAISKMLGYKPAQLVRKPSFYA